ncbi:MAG: PTS sugar transporter subunit IIB [Allobaculum sp.]
MRILLACNAGLSTSLLARKINLAAKAMSRSDKAQCIDIDKIDDLIGESDILFLAPQLLHAYNRIWKTYHQQLPIALVPGQCYGLLDGEGLLKYADEILAAYQSNPELKFNHEPKSRKNR